MTETLAAWTALCLLHACSQQHIGSHGLMCSCRAEGSKAVRASSKPNMASMPSWREVPTHTTIVLLPLGQCHQHSPAHSSQLSSPPLPLGQHVHTGLTESSVLQAPALPGLKVGGSCSSVWVDSFSSSAIFLYRTILAAPFSKNPNALCYYSKVSLQFPIKFYLTFS